MSWDAARYPLAATDQDWAENRIQGGLGTGEGLIYAVRDPVSSLQSVKDPTTKATVKKLVETDPGVCDKRLLVVETELGRTLSVMNRDKNVLSQVLRQCWDDGGLRNLTGKIR